MKVNSAAGFSYIDVMIAIVILMVGILAMLSGISGAVLQAKGQEQHLTAKHIMTSTIESIMAVKETDPLRMGWDAVGNVGSNLDKDGVPHGIFVNGTHDVRTNAGPDEVMGTADDNGATIPGYQRQIVITDICDPDRPSANCPTPGTWPIRIRSVEVVVTFFVGQATREERLRTVLTDYAVED